VKPGEAVPVLERTIELDDMVAYAGATWDWHRLHYDTEFARARGLKAPVVDGQMLGALMAEHALDRLGPGAFITKIGFRLRSMVVAGETVRVEGEVSEADAGSVTLAQRVLVGERVAAEGTTSARL
jgi:acyl dehydratase